MYEVAFIEDGKLVRGGIKADFLTASEWARENAEQDPYHVWVVVHASDKAMTKEELYAELDALLEAQDDA